MSVLPVLIHPHPILRQVAEPVTDFGRPVLSLVRNMFDTMIKMKGVGLAAPQVGIGLRLVVVGYKQHQMALINPTIVAQSGEEWGEEGCLSLPDVNVVVPRSTRITVTAHTPSGRPIQLNSLGGYVARIIQHEMDHLNGILIIDKGEAPHDHIIHS